MFKQYVFIACLFSVFYFARSSTPPILKCKSDDSECIKKSSRLMIPVFADGIPEYNVETLEPLKIKSINATEGNLLFLLNDVTIVGLKNCEVKKISRDKEKFQIHLTLKCTATLDGTYILKGSVLVVPLQGKGKIHVDLNAAEFDVTFDLHEKQGDDGKIHWAIKSFKFIFNLKEKCKVVFENLNKGNELLEQAGNALLKSSPNDIIKEIGFPVFQTVISIIMKNVNRMFKVLSADQLSLD